MPRTIATHLESRGGSEWRVSPPCRARAMRKAGHVNVERGCRPKQAYLSKRDAKAISRSMSARHREAFHIYACPSCRYWHVAHAEPAALRARVVPSWERRAVQVA